MAGGWVLEDGEGSGPGQGLTVLLRDWPSQCLPCQRLRGLRQSTNSPLRGSFLALPTQGLTAFACCIQGLTSAPKPASSPVSRASVSPTRVRGPHATTPSRVGDPSCLLQSWLRAGEREARISQGPCLPGLLGRGGAGGAGGAAGLVVPSWACNYGFQPGSEEGAAQRAGLRWRLPSPWTSEAAHPLSPLSGSLAPGCPTPARARPAGEPASEGVPMSEGTHLDLPPQPQPPSHRAGLPT